MRAISARTLVAAPWIVTVALVALAARLGTPAIVLTAIAGFLAALGVSDLIMRRFRTSAREVRALTIAAHDSQRATAAAIVAEMQMLAVMESITQGILQVNAAGRLVQVNPAGRELLNLPIDVLGQAVATLIRHPELRMYIERAARGESFESVEFVFDQRQLLVSSRPLRSEHTDQVSGAVIAVVDLTEFRRLESVRRDFVANVSHELKTPLTSIRGYTETLLTDDLSPEMRQQFLEVVHKNAERIQRIVDDLLDLSRLQSGGWQPELQPVDPVAFAQDVWADCEAAEGKGIGFAIAATTEQNVLADPGGLRQVLSNLFDNAIRYTPAGGNVTVAIQSQGSVVELVIRDTGTGIPRDALPRIFERFYRVNPARSRQEGGTGLGLAIVKHLVERMSGDVFAESELGKGTTIHVILPVAKER
jgi:two-component system, OmpR family, phosphate regulon sensor histidine kinase PhoR